MALGRSVSDTGRGILGSRLVLGLFATVVIVLGSGWFHLANHALWAYVSNCGHPLDPGERFGLSLVTLTGRGAFITLAAALLWVLVLVARWHPRRFLTALAGVLGSALLSTWAYVALLAWTMDDTTVTHLQIQCSAVSGQ